MKTVPLHISFDEKTILIVGGGPVALRKLRVFQGSGARVRVVAPVVLTEFDSHDGIEIFRRKFKVSDLQDVDIVIAATNREELNRRIGLLARQRHRLVNVVGEPELGDVIFSSILRRDPLTISISTGGAAPALARVIRQNLESEFEPCYGAAVTRIGQVRSDLKARCVAPETRSLINKNLANLIWEARGETDDPHHSRLFKTIYKLVERDLVATEGLKGGASAERDVRERIAGEAAKVGELILIGAGPGATDLITLAGLKALAFADIVIHDRLVTPDLLAYAPDAIHIPVGRHEGGKAAAAHAEIDRMIVEYARAGLRVVRLKGGDPMVFGRAAEELAAARKAGIPCRVIPGVTAACGAAAEKQIPLTLRGVSASVAFVTGHRMQGVRPPEWKALASAVDTLTIYMGVGNCCEIARELIAAGRSREEPVAMVEQATLPESRVSYYDLGAIAFDGAAADVQPPCLIIIGRSVLMGRRLPLDFTDENDLSESGIPDSKPVLTAEDWSVS